MPRRSFTPKDANRTLPLVRRIVADVLATGQSFRACSREPQTPARERRLGELERALRSLLAELAAVGCEYKDWGFDKGLVDFPAVIDGKPVLLCWRSDEPAVAWYHDRESGFAGRAAIPARLLEAAETPGARAPRP